MIAKGTTHNNGAKLASYMTTSKEGEHAELWQLRGFEATTIKDAFRDVQIMAEGTKCEQPFFHVQVRNREGEALTRQQWEVAANRIERMLGLTGQPRAMAFHTYEHNNDEHMHVAWSRIDEDRLIAKELPFFKERLKKVSRELELHFGFRAVKNERDGAIKYAPTKAQDEQARRLGVDIHAIRNTIRYCYDHSDCGKSFQAAVEQEDLILAKGDRRNFVVIDQAGGIHALGKRILDVTPAQISARLSDLVREELPSVEEIRLFVNELKSEPLQQKSTPVWDRDHADRQWQDAVVNAAIEKEKNAREFVEPRESTKAKEQGGRKEGWSVQPPQPERKSPGLFEEAARGATRDNRTEDIKGEIGKVWAVWCQSESDKAIAAALDGKTISFPVAGREDFAAGLNDKGIAFAAANKAEADRSHREAEFAKAIGNYAPRYKEGEIVIVTEPRLEYRREGHITEPRRVHKIDQSLAEKFVNHLGSRSQLQGIEATKQVLDERARQRATDREANRLEYATNPKNRAQMTAADLKKGVHKSASVAGKVLGGMGKSVHAVSDAFDSLLSPKLTPEQIIEGERSALKREAEADQSIDFSRAVGERAQERQNQQEQQAARDRQRELERDR